MWFYYLKQLYMIYRLILFLILNFATIGFGRFLGGEGPKSEFYLGINTAPWIPPGVVIGISWTILLICFSVYLSYLWPVVGNKKFLLGLLVVYYILSLIWNPVFFQYQQVLAGFLIIAALAMVVGFIMAHYWSVVKLKSFLVLPYFLWLLFATSLNLYIIIKN